MMNYQEMSDFEIDAAVAAIMHPGLKITNFAGEAVVWFENLHTKVIRYCNSWADAGPIIQENRISIFYDSEDDYHRNDDDRVYWWNAISFDTGFQHNAESNPLRAAMVVFLMMKGGE